MKEKPLRIAVVGVGGAAQLIHLPILIKSENVEVVALVDEEGFKLSKVCEKFGLPGFEDIKGMLDRVKPDVVLICTPTISHLPLALSVLEFGAHVILEKPVTRSLSEAKKLARASEETKKYVLVGMNLRFRQDVSILKNFIRAGELGQIKRIHATWMKRYGAWNRSDWLDTKRISGGGVLMDLGIQMLDLSLWLLGFPKLKRVSGFIGNHNLKRRVEDTITGNLVFEDNCLLHLDCSWGILSDRDINYNRFEGSKATATLNPLVIHSVVHEELVTMSPVKSVQGLDQYNASFESEMHHFLRVIREGEDPISTIHDAVKVLDVVDLLYKSAEKGHEIEIEGN